MADKPNIKESNIDSGADKKMAQLKILMIAVVLLVIMMGGATVAFLMSFNKEIGVLAENTKKLSKAEKNAKEKGNKSEALEDTKEEGKEGAKVAIVKPQFYKFTPSIVTNVMSKDQIKYIRIDVELMTKNESDLENIRNYGPLLRSEVVSILNSAPFDDFATVEARDKVRKRILDKLKSVMTEHVDHEVIDQVLFTNFVIQ